MRRGPWHAGSSANEILASLRQLQLSRAESAPTSWGLQVGSGGFASPRGALFAGFNAGFCGLPSAPTGPVLTCGDSRWLEEEEPAERVESGRALRAKMFQRLSKGSTFEKAEAAPDVGWVTELLN
ncbi:zinc finger CCCH domain-containing protein [Musa troglodytarum]|uniref:Zinc finger CCCH domain-containing protein n=1 Tax=Musa troglodytarum TaxID=320322 RepID=A0A9E7LC10_9LILI|nr:zinc finger CCCH domain-containing protein [Musa troglodytarum]